MVQYDPAIILTEATRLYAEAEKIVGVMTMRGALAGILAGLLLGGFMGDAAAHALLGGAFVGSVVLGLLGAYFGYQAGQAKAFYLRLEAQRILVLAQIEMNTRPR